VPVLIWLVAGFDNHNPTSSVFELARAERALEQAGDEWVAIGAFRTASYTIYERHVGAAYIPQPKTNPLRDRRQHERPARSLRQAARPCWPGR
jgi:hypothetical protein